MESIRTLLDDFVTTHITNRETLYSLGLTLSSIILKMPYNEEQVMAWGIAAYYFPKDLVLLKEVIIEGAQKENFFLNKTQEINNLNYGISNSDIDYVVSKNSVKVLNTIPKKSTLVINAIKLTQYSLDMLHSDKTNDKKYITH